MSTKTEGSEVAEVASADDPAADDTDREATLDEMAARMDALERENQELRQRVDELEGERDELENTVDFLKQELFSLEDIVTGDYDTGIASVHTEDDGGLLPRVEEIEENGVETDTQRPQMDRSSMLPLHRMMVDMQTGAGDSLDKSQERGAALFERFVNKAKGEANQNVTPDGQKFTMNTEQAIEVLLEEDLLNVKEQSRSRIAGRVMRDVQRFTIADAEEHEENCTDIDSCSDHGLVTFRPGKPHTLTVNKKRMEAVVINTAQSASDKDVRTTDDAVNGENTAEDSSVEAEMDRLEQAERGEKDA